MKIQERPSLQDQMDDLREQGIEINGDMDDLAETVENIIKDLTILVEHHNAKKWYQFWRKK